MGKKSKQKKNNNTMSLVEFMATNVDDERKLDKMTKDPRLLNLPTRPKGEDEREDDMFHERQDRGERRGGGFDDRDRDGEEISWDRIGPLQPAKGAGGGFRSGGGGFERDGNFDDRPREDADMSWDRMGPMEPQLQRGGGFGARGDGERIERREEDIDWQRKGPMESLPKQDIKRDFRDGEREREREIDWSARHGPIAAIQPMRPDVNAEPERDWDTVRKGATVTAEVREPVKDLDWQRPTVAPSPPPPVEEVRSQGNMLRNSSRETMFRSPAVGGDNMDFKRRGPLELRQSPPESNQPEPEVDWTRKGPIATKSKAPEEEVRRDLERGENLPPARPPTKEIDWSIRRGPLEPRITEPRGGWRDGKRRVDDRSASNGVSGRDTKNLESSVTNLSVSSKEDPNEATTKDENETSNEVDNDDGWEVVKKTTKLQPAEKRHF